MTNNRHIEERNTLISLDVYCRHDYIVHLNTPDTEITEIWTSELTYGYNWYKKLCKQVLQLEV